MAIVIFTNAFEGNASKNIAINSDKVISVFEILDPLDKKKKKMFTNIYVGKNEGDVLSWTVSESFEEVVKKLNDNS
jgi:hypothetical protein